MHNPIIKRQVSHMDWTNVVAGSVGHDNEPSGFPEFGEVLE
jgi:hypothetical protein